MKKSSLTLIVSLLFVATSVSMGSIILYTPASGDCSFAYNSKYSSYDNYTQGGTTMGVYLYMGGSYGNDYTIGIFEIPIASLASQTLTNATLVVNSNGFDTGYYYGSAQIGWLNTGTATLTGNVVADGLGPAAKSRPTGYEIWDTYDVPNGAGTKYFDFTTQVQADIDAGRTYSTFVLHGSRETYGSINAAESGSGPQLVVTLVPEPTTVAILTIGGLLLRKRK